MAKNAPRGDGRRIGAVRHRSQFQNPINGHWYKRDAKPGGSWTARPTKTRSKVSGVSASD